MTTDRSHVPQLEAGIHVDLQGRRTYADYLLAPRRSMNRLTVWHPHEAKTLTTARPRGMWKKRAPGPAR